MIFRKFESTRLIRQVLAGNRQKFDSTSLSRQVSAGNLSLSWEIDRDHNYPWREPRGAPRVSADRYLRLTDRYK